MKLIRREPRDWYDPFATLENLQDEMSRLFSHSLIRRPANDWRALFTPEIDVTEEENQYLVKADLPGLKKEDVQVTISGNLLTLKGERKEEAEKKGKNFFHSERRYGSFERTVELASEVDAAQAKASYKDGVLELTLPKSENAKPKQIKVDIK